jgi:aminomethyltransferase
MPKATPLLETHRALGGKIVEFAGFLMPLHYSGVIDEHRAVRSGLGVFDVSHMGEVLFEGPGALAAARRMVTANVLALRDGQVLYTPICYPDGGIVDDCLVYRLSATRVLFVVNASNIDKDFAWLAGETGGRCRVSNLSDDYALLALQGPRAAETLAPLAAGGVDVRAMPSFSFLELEVGGVRVTASRTGYTGEDGFEIGCAPADAPALWARLMEAGAAHGIKPCGLGARDTLRLEARLPLYGNDIDATTTPLEAGLGWTVKLKEGDFIGREALLRQKQEGLKRKLVCLEMRSRGIARHGHPIHLPAAAGALGAAIGQVTSGTTAPWLGKAIALGYVPTAQAEVGTRLAIDVRGKPVAAEVVKGPFYKRAA